MTNKRWRVRWTAPMTEDEKEEMFKIVDAILWHEAERMAATGRLSVAQTHRTMWRLLEKGIIYLTTDNAVEEFTVRYCPWWRWRTRRDYAANGRWLVDLHRKRMSV